MNKQEIIKRLKDVMPEDPIDDFQRGKETVLTYALELVEELEKPVVQQFVADWYENNKYDFEYNLYRLCTLYTERKLFKEFDEWFDNDNNKLIETLVLMHKFGYEVEKEKLYTVEIPNNLTLTHIILTRNIGGEINLIETQNNDWEELEYAQLTEDEIKKDFEWAWQFAKEVEYD